MPFKNPRDPGSSSLVPGKLLPKSCESAVNCSIATAVRQILTLMQNYGNMQHHLVRQCAVYNYQSHCYQNILSISLLNHVLSLVISLQVTPLSLGQVKRLPFLAGEGGSRIGWSDRLPFLRGPRSRLGADEPMLRSLRRSPALSQEQEEGRWTGCRHERAH